MVGVQVRGVWVPNHVRGRSKGASTGFVWEEHSPGRVARALVLALWGQSLPHTCGLSAVGWAWCGGPGWLRGPVIFGRVVACGHIGSNAFRCVGAALPEKVIPFLVGVPRLQSSVVLLRGSARRRAASMLALLVDLNFEAIVALEVKTQRRKQLWVLKSKPNDGSNCGS
jgi:hypothetical protein|eukprot:TRINITY_DN752_c0_g1_i1.p2 TRINITY_DN752_c0_g1~~TRINITY_DN752_c0_g1_i1.p2  ORF type:complete len:169 (-),score=2.81 TRINITY_DN752_c0_g1_i1:23-529(-)